MKSFLSKLKGAQLNWDVCYWSPLTAWCVPARQL